MISSIVLYGMNATAPGSKVGTDMAKPRKQRRLKAKGRRGANPKEATLLIPLTYNDGTRIPVDIFESIQEELYLAFHGWTIEGTVKGV
jgi:hypothetical protein